MKKIKVGILGATGTVGKQLVKLLDNHPFFELKVLAASPKSCNKTYEEVIFKKFSSKEKIPKKFLKFKILNVENSNDITKQVDFVFCALNMENNKLKNLEEEYAKKECPVVSNNSAHRKTSDVPIIIPEINHEHLKILEFQKQRLKVKRGFIVAKPNCSLQNYVPAIHPLIDLKPLKILVCSYQAISGAGKTFSNWPEMKDNLIAYIPKEEEKTQTEPLKIWGKIENKKIINKKNLDITSQCFRVPITNGHTSAVFVSFKNKINEDEIIKKWENYKSIPQKLSLPSAPKKFLNYFEKPDQMQIKLTRNLENGMAISIGRLRKDSQYDFRFVCMSHNILRGAAGGALLTAELLFKQGYFRR